MPNTPRYLDILANNISANGMHVDVEPEHNAMDAQLETPLFTVDGRPRRLKEPNAMHESNYNSLYNSLMTDDMIDRVSDYTFISNSSITNSVLNSIPVVLPAATTKPFIVKRWPDGTQAYLLLRHFSIMPTTTGAVGDLQCYFQDGAGNTIPLGDFSAGNGGVVQSIAILPMPITDSGLINFGTLQINWLGGTAAITVGYSLGFTAIYLVPAHKPFKD